MLELSILGGVTLSRDGQALPWPQRGWQRAALFALLGARYREGVDRMSVAELLWPASSVEAARHSLDELLSRARRETGEPELFAAGQALRLNLKAVAIDLASFDQALAGWHLERACAMYKGPVADGLRITGSPALEQTLEGLRRTTHDKWRDATRQLAVNATQQGNHDHAIDCWRRLLREDPLDREAVLAVAGLLGRAGRSGEARAIVNAFRVLSLETFGEVDAAIIDLDQQLRSQLVTPTKPVAAIVSVDGFEDKRRAAVQRLLGSDYRVDGLRREESVTAVYAARLSAATRTAVEVHCLQPRVAAGVSPIRFQSIFRRVAAVSHPGLLCVRECRCDADVMLVITGVSTRPHLRDRLKQGALPIAEAVKVMLGVTDGLRAAHAAGVLHGDLRPKRIALPDGGTVLQGLGFRELVSGEAAPDDRSTLMWFGNPKYQSPEQLTDSSVLSVASDVYACGCILFEMLTASVPFYSPREGTDVSRRLTAEAPRARSLRSTVPPALDEAVACALSPHAADRFASMADFHRALAPGMR